MVKLKLFYWSAINIFQQKQKGMIVAEGQDQARTILFQRGLKQIKLQQNWQWNSQPKSAELSDLLTQLAILLKSAVPLKNSLNILLDNCTNIALNLWLRRVILDLESGLSFSQALEKQQQYIHHQERQLIKVGEMTGNLASVCEQIAQYRQQTLKLQRKIQKILLYPVMVLGISLILTFLLLIFIVPQFAQMYGENQAQLPTFTALLLYLSSGLQCYFWHMVCLTVVVSIFIRRQLKSSPWLNRQKGNMMARIPILNHIVRLSRLVGFCRGLYLMLHAGIPLNQALHSFLPQTKSWQTKAVIQGDFILTEEVQHILHRVNQGYPFSESVSGALFPLQAQQMLQVGEKSGKLAMMLQHIAENHQQQLDHQIDLLSQMLEPLLMVIIGGIIGLIMLGMYLPIFNMGSMIQ